MRDLQFKIMHFNCSQAAFLIRSPQSFHPFPVYNPPKVSLSFLPPELQGFLLLLHELLRIEVPQVTAVGLPLAGGIN